MILVKSDLRLKKVFERLIKTYGENVDWNGYFVIAAGNLMLPGRVRTLCFQLEQKKMLSRVIDLQADFTKAEDAQGNEVLANVFNIILYAFGKWGIIPGLRVDKDYGQLNQLFLDVLKEVKVDVKFDGENLKFYFNEETMAYEDVIRRALDWAKPEIGFAEENIPQEEVLGLWHNMQWKLEKKEITRKILDNMELEGNRLGHHFYPVDYQCPFCHGTMSMVVFPVDQEILVETQEGRVYLSRIYTCKDCMKYYTPTPGRLIREGEFYTLTFEDDNKAYEDYMDLLGRVGDRCSNYKFNEFESDRLKKEEIEPIESTEAIVQEQINPNERFEKLTEETLRTLIQLGESDNDYLEKNHISKQDLELEWRRRQTYRSETLDSVYSVKKEKNLGDNVQSLSGEKREKAPKDIQKPSIETKIDEQKPIQERKKEENKKQNQEEVKKENKKQNIEEKGQEEKQIQEEQLLKDANHDQDLDTIKDNIEHPSERKANQSERIKKQEKAIYEKVKSCQGKTYAQVKTILDEIQLMEAPLEVKNQVLFNLSQYRVKQAGREAEVILAKLPLIITKTVYENCKKQLDFYGEEDVANYIKLLKDKRNESERKEIGEIIKQAKKINRDDLNRLYQSLGTQEFQEENLKPFKEKIYAKIYEMDEAEIFKICPDIRNMSFESGNEAINKISRGMFLPELKQKTLNMLDKRLIKMKVDENIQLVRKLKKEIEFNVEDLKKLHFYNAGNVMRAVEESEEEEKEEETYAKRAANTIGAEYGRYEYPIFIGDSSRTNNGKEGFIITPERLLIKTLFQSVSLRIVDIESLTIGGVFRKYIQINLSDGSHKKLPSVIKSQARGTFTKVMGDFIKYLQDKPESRKIAYLAHDKHTIICCYRCGFKYSDTIECPQCGYKHNH